MPPTDAEFEAWVTWCFAQPASLRTTAPREPDWHRSLTPTVLCEHLVRLFRDPAFLLTRYDDEELAGGISHIFCVSEYFKDLVYEPVAADLQRAVFASMSTLYRDLFDPACARSKRPNLHGAVFMVWEPGGASVIFGPHAENADLVTAGFDVLAAVLAECRTETCLLSALHGLNHVAAEQPQRVAEVIDEFLATRDVPKDVRDYAAGARAGRMA